MIISGPPRQATRWTALSSLIMAWSRRWSPRTGSRQAAQEYNNRPHISQPVTRFQKEADEDDTTEAGPLGHFRTSCRCFPNRCRLPCTSSWPQPQLRCSFHVLAMQSRGVVQEKNCFILAGRGCHLDSNDRPHSRFNGFDESSWKAAAMQISFPES